MLISKVGSTHPTIHLSNMHTRHFTSHPRVSFPTATGTTKSISTRSGDLTVTICGDTTLNPCIAYPEVGFNGSTCFLPLILAAGSQSLLLKHHYFIFIEPAASPTQPPTITDYALQLQDIVSHFKLKEVLGMGMGIGGYIMTKFAADNPRILSGLILISPCCQAVGWSWEWLTGLRAVKALEYSSSSSSSSSSLPAKQEDAGNIDNSSIIYSNTSEWSVYAKSHFASRLFGNRTIQTDMGKSDIVDAFERDCQHVSPTGTAAYLKACIYREDILEDARRVKCRILLLYGRESLYCKDCEELATVVNKGRFAVMEVAGVGTAICQEAPTEVLGMIQSYLTALQLEGYGLGAGLIVGE